jgi:hypothetical protein
MKNILIILALFLGSCDNEQLDKKNYRLEVTYTNGDINVLTYEGYGDNHFSLKQGDLMSHGNALTSGVRSFKVLSVIKIVGVKDETDCQCDLKLIQTEK